MSTSHVDTDLPQQPRCLYQRQGERRIIRRIEVSPLYRCSSFRFQLGQCTPCTSGEQTAGLVSNVFLSLTSHLPPSSTGKSVTIIITSQHSEHGKYYQRLLNPCMHVIHLISQDYHAYNGNYELFYLNCKFITGKYHNIKYHNCLYCQPPCWRGLCTCCWPSRRPGGHGRRTAPHSPRPRCTATASQPPSSARWSPANISTLFSLFLFVYRFTKQLTSHSCCAFLLWLSPVY